MNTITQPVATKDDIVHLLRRHRTDIQRLGVRRIGVFGSFVRGQQHAESDVDVLVEFHEGGATFDNFMDLCFLLEDAFGRKVEVVSAKYLSPFIGPHILREVEYVRLDD